VCGGPWLGEPGATICGEELRLDLRAGVLLRRFRVTDPAGRRTCVTERRLVSMADPHLAAIALELVAENWAGTLRVRAGIDGTCCADQTTEARLLSHCHLVIAGSGDGPRGVVWLAARTTQSGVVIAEAARTLVTGAAGPPRLHARGRHIGHEHAVELAEGPAATRRRSPRSTPRRTRRSPSRPPPPARRPPPRPVSVSCSPPTAPRGRGCGHASR
jgi:trehalose/maltose hydrolase-like predicted phosphorylase